MTRPIAPLPTPEQIAAAPELVALHALAQLLELTLRTLVAAHPGLGELEVPYWAIDPSRARRAAHPLLMAASHLETGIQEYLAALDLDQQTDATRLDDDLPF